MQHTLSSLVCHHFLLSYKYSVTVGSFELKCAGGEADIHNLLVMHSFCSVQRMYENAYYETATANK